jgi:hypothetical protein
MNTGGLEFKKFKNEITSRMAKPCPEVAVTKDNTTWETKLKEETVARSPQKPPASFR